LGFETRSIHPERGSPWRGLCASEAPVQGRHGRHEECLPLGRPRGSPSESGL
jgi:hypothetical protein